MENVILKKIGSDFQIGGSEAELLIGSTIDELNANGNYDRFVDEFFEKNAEFDDVKGKTRAIPQSVKSKMIEILLGFDLNIKEFRKAEHNDFFSFAYAEANKVSKGGEDPIDALRNNGSVSEWDFTFDSNESETGNIIIKENIKAAGALYNLYLLGDQLNMFALTDNVILKWWNGAIDVPKGDLSNKMYRFYKLRSERNTVEDRGMLYKRIFNMGDGKEMDGVLVNDDFVSLWDNLLNEVVKYIDKREDKISNEDVISKQPIFRAIRQIQYNLSSSMTGIASISTREIYANYLECKFILGHKELINQVTKGRARNINEVIRTLSAELYHEIPNVSAYFDTATTITYLFDFISDFNGISVSSEDFEDFVAYVDDYILNMELVDKNKNAVTPDKEDEETEDEFISANGKDEFDEF